MRTSAGRARTRAVLVAVVGCCAVVLTACSDDDRKASVTPSASPSLDSASPRPSSTESDDEDAALAAYTQSWQEQTKAYANASSKGTDLKKVTTLRALAGIEKDLTALRNAGQVTTGKPALLQDPKVTVSSAEIPRATISDCVDTTNWTLIEKDSKKKVALPTQRLTKYVSVAKLEKWGEQWMVTELTPQEEEC